MGSLTLAPNLGKLLALDPAVQMATIDAAEEILEAATAEAPVDTGALAASGHIETGEDAEGFITAEVVFDVGYAAYVEFGTSFTPVNDFLRRGAEIAGYDIG